MIRRIVCLVFGLAVITVLQAQSNLLTKSSLPDSLEQAIQRVEKSPNADLYYNLGVDFFTLGDAGQANLYFLRALNINSAHKYARANLDISTRLGQDAKLYPEHLFLVRVLLQTLDFFSVNRLAILSLIFFLGSALAFIWLLFYNPDKERALPILVLALLLLLTVSSFTALGIKSFQQKHDSRAVVVVALSPFYPPKGNSTLFEVHAGLVLKVLNTRGSYWLVRLPDGQTGRLKAVDLQKVLQEQPVRK